MAINKPNVPSAELPDDWGGTQTPYTEQQAQEGYPEAVPTVIDGGNLNYEKRGIFQHIKYFKVFADWLRNIPIGKIPVVNSKGQLDYDDPVTDSEVVHITGDEDIDGIKTFKQGIKGTFENYCAYNAATNDKPWKKLMEITLSGTYNTINIPFMMNNPVSAKFGWGSGTINLRNENVAGTLNSAISGIHFNILPNWWVHYDYKLLYKNNYPETGKILIEFWVKISSAYAGVCFTILDMLSGGIGKFDRSKITWYNNTQQYAELPTGYNEISYTVDTMQTKTPQTGSNSKEIATTEWYNNKHKVVSALPSSPTTGVTYLIPQTEELTTTSYIPDYASYVDIADNTYTAPSDGWIFWRATGTGGQVKVNGVVVGLAGNYTDQPFAQFLVGKGDIITCSAKDMFRFIPFKK